MSYIVVCSIALLASCLTFFSGFGLGTLLLPAFALFFAVEMAVALTAVVHFFNGVFKLALVWRHIDFHVAWRFGVFAVIGALAGAWALLVLAKGEPLGAYTIVGRHFEIVPVKLTVGAALLLFACMEFVPRFRELTFSPRYLFLGGLVSGFFGGLAGMQGALRSAFLVKVPLSKESYIATGAAIAFLIDVTRLSLYWRLFAAHHIETEYLLLLAATLSAFIGSVVGSRLLPKVTMRGVQRMVAVFLLLVAAGLMSGVL